MKGTVLYGPRDIRFEHREDPKIIEPTDAILRLAATCVCGSDLWPYRGIQKIDGPTPMGHEYCGIVEEVGSAVKSIKPLLELIRANIKCEDIDQEYRGITIKGRRLLPDEPLNRELNMPDAQKPFRLTYYYAEIGEGIYFSVRPEPIKQLVDQHKDAKERKPDGDEISAALRVLPRAAENAREALQMFLEWQTHRRAMPTNAVWHALHHSVITPGASDEQRRAMARQYLGYLPVSPDGSDYRYDPRTDEVVNRRHGSYRQPILWPALAADAQLVKGRPAMPLRIIPKIRSRSSPTSGSRGSRTHSQPSPTSCTASLMYWTNFVCTSRCNSGVNQR